MYNRRMMCSWTVGLREGPLCQNYSRMVMKNCLTWGVSSPVPAIHTCLSREKRAVWYSVRRVLAAPGHVRWPSAARRGVRCQGLRMGVLMLKMPSTPLSDRQPRHGTRAICASSLQDLQADLHLETSSNEFRKIIVSREVGACIYSTSAGTRDVVRRRTLLMKRQARTARATIKCRFTFPRCEKYENEEEITCVYICASAYAPSSLLSGSLRRRNMPDPDRRLSIFRASRERELTYRQSFPQRREVWQMYIPPHLFHGPADPQLKHLFQGPRLAVRASSSRSTSSK